MKIIAVIPARYASTRFEGKPLKLLQNKPMLQWVVEAARKSKNIREVIVATDDERISELCKNISVPFVMTSPDCPTGTDRIFQATKNMDFDVVVNVQGDEPLIDPEYMDLLANAFADKNIEMATLAHPLSEEDLQNKNAVKVLLNQQSEAIYFSRYAVPFSRQSFSSDSHVLKHIGLYAYTKSFLNKFCNEPACFLEKAESLEQLRALFLGIRIKVLKVEKPTLGVDTPEDLERIEKMLKAPQK